MFYTFLNQGFESVTFQSEDPDPLVKDSTKNATTPFIKYYQNCAYACIVDMINIDKQLIPSLSRIKLHKKGSRNIDIFLLMKVIVILKPILRHFIALD